VVKVFILTMTDPEGTYALAVFISPKKDFRSGGDQLELKRAFIGNKLKTSKRAFGLP